MKRLIYILLIIVTVTVAGLDCKEVYTPPAIKNNPFLLVVDGIVISGNDSSIITLSRTRNIADTVPSVRELSAKVSVLGTHFTLKRHTRSLLFDEGFHTQTH